MWIVLKLNLCNQNSDLVLIPTMNLVDQMITTPPGEFEFTMRCEHGAFRTRNGSWTVWARGEPDATTGKQVQFEWHGFATAEAALDWLMSLTYPSDTQAE